MGGRDAAPGVDVTIPGLGGNWALNPTVHTLGGWCNRLTGTTLTLDVASPISAPNSALVTKTSQFGSLAYLRLTGGYVTPANPDDISDPQFQSVVPTVGTVMTWTFDIRCDVECMADVGMFTMDINGNQIDGVEELHRHIPANTVTRVGCSLLIPAGSVGVWLDVNIDPEGTTVVGTRTWLDNLLVEPDSGRDWVPPDVNGYHPPGVYDPARYCDGDTEGYTWEGLAGQSVTVEDIAVTFAEPEAVVYGTATQTLGCGEATVYLYDRGGQQRLYRFEAGAVARLEWERLLSDTGTATLTLQAELCDCMWLGRIRSVRMELVIYRDEDRVWEGPITRISYTPTTVTIIAKDLSWWFGKRVLQSNFATGNAVDLAYGLAQQAFTFDDPNAYNYLMRNNNQGPTYTIAYNKTDGYVIDALDDLVKAGIDWAVLGRRIFFWASVNPVARANMLRAGQDFAAEITVFEDGESLATRAYSTGGDTWGEAILTGSDLLPAIVGYEPVTTNYAKNPSLRINTTGFDPYTTRFFTVTRPTSGWPSSAGGSFGKLGVKIPAAGSDAESDYRGYEMVLSMKAQAMTVAKGMQVSAVLLVRPTGTLGTNTDPDKQNTLSLCWRGKLKDGTIDDRPFVEGPPTALKSGSDTLLFVTGSVPDDMVSAWVEVSRDTSNEWKNGADGFWFDRFGMWVGRVESWFDGDTKDTVEFSYEWLSSVGQSQSSRFFHNTNPRARQRWPIENEYQKRISDYYGIVDNLADSNSTTREELEGDAISTLMRAFPSPLGIDIPQNAPVMPEAPVTINELMPGTIVPIQSDATCRQVGAQPVLESVKATYTPEDGEEITITLVTSQAWIVEPLPDPEPGDGAEDDDGDLPETLPIDTP